MSILSQYYLNLAFSTLSVLLIKNKWPHSSFESTLTPPPPRQSPEISTWTRTCLVISCSVSPVMVTTKGKQLPIAVNMNVSFTCIQLIDMQSCTLYNAFVHCFIFDDFVAKTNCECMLLAPSNMYSVISSVETIKPERTGETGVPHALEHNWVTSLWVQAETLFLLEGQDHCLILEWNGYSQWELCSDQCTEEVLSSKYCCCLQEATLGNGNVSLIGEQCHVVPFCCTGKFRILQRNETSLFNLFPMIIR